MRTVLIITALIFGGCTNKDASVDSEDSSEIYDLDGDGQLSVEHGGLDCDDTNPTVYYDAPELCDGIDNDCDVWRDDPANIDEDTDVDGYPACATGEPGDDFYFAGDCDNNNPWTFPVPEWLGLDIENCDGVDNDCDGLVDEGLSANCANEDNDGDGYTPAQGDCFDGDGGDWVSPGLPEACDGVDTNCDGIIPDDELDRDGDQFFLCTRDADGTAWECDDNDPYTYRRAPEICDGVDNNCDGIIPQREEDRDGDGLMECEE